MTDEWPRLAHISNLTKGRHRLTRAEQTVAANEWWCEHTDKDSTLSCRRHRLQQRHRATTNEQEREAIRKELSALLEGAGSPAFAELQEETRKMLRSFCALATSRRLEVCTNRAHTTPAPQRRRRPAQNGARAGKGKGKGKSKGGVHAPASTGRAVNKRRRHSGGPRGIAALWTPEALALMRAWWCADRRHTREPRCARGVRWTRQQPGLSAMRRLYCAQNAAPLSSSTSVPNASKSTPTMRLCLGSEGAAGAAVYEGSSAGTDVYGTIVPSELRSGGGTAGVGGNGRARRPTHVVRQSTVLKLMIAMLALAALIGWKARHHCIGRRGGAVTAPLPAAQTATALPPPGERGDEAVVNSAAPAAARRRVHLAPAKRVRSV